MAVHNRLRHQVDTEIRIRRIIFYTLMFLSFIYIITSLVFGDMGLIKYIDLHKKKSNLETGIKEIERENQLLKLQIKLLKEDPFFKEKYAREEFGLAKPDEYIFQYDR